MKQVVIVVVDDQAVFQTDFARFAAHYYQLSAFSFRKRRLAASFFG